MKRRELLLVALLPWLVMAPTAGNIGSCGQPVEELDAGLFFREKARIDCLACDACGIITERCIEACAVPAPITFPEGCFPLVHDGQVCLDALEAADCDEYINYMADISPTVPTECNFCPPRGGQDPVAGAGGAGGATSAGGLDLEGP